MASGDRSDPYPGLKYLNLHLTVLKYAGMWPADEMHGKISTKFVLKVIMWFMLVGIIPDSVTMLHATRYFSESLVSVLEDFVLLGAFGFCCTFVFIDLTLYEKMVVFMGKFYERYPEPEDVEEMGRKDQSQLKMCLIGLFVGITSNLVYVTVNFDKCQATKTEADVATTCGFLMPVWLPFDYNYGPVRAFILFSQYCGLLYFTSITWTQQMIFVSLVRHTSTAFDTLTARIAEVDVRDGPQATKNQLSKVVALHIKLCRTVTDLGQMIELSSLLLGVGTIINSGLLIILILVVISPNGLLILVVWFFGLSGIMALGQIFIDKSNDINEAFYNLPWYEMDTKCKSVINFALMRTQQPLNIRNRFFDMSLGTLLVIGSKAYSMTTFLLQVASD